eukprot:1137584-Pelagomonas_calceolata.AAC.3
MLEAGHGVRRRSFSCPLCMDGCAGCGACLLDARSRTWRALSFHFFPLCMDGCAGCGACLLDARSRTWRALSSLFFFAQMVVQGVEHVCLILGAGHGMHCLFFFARMAVQAVGRICLTHSAGHGTRWCGAHTRSRERKSLNCARSKGVCTVLCVMRTTLFTYASMRECVEMALCARQMAAGVWGCDCSRDQSY